MIEFQYERPAAVNFREPPFLLLLLLPVRFSLTSSHLLGVVMVFRRRLPCGKKCDENMYDQDSVVC